MAPATKYVLRTVTEPDNALDLSKTDKGQEAFQLSGLLVGKD